jgi:putative DNA methylase
VALTTFSDLVDEAREKVLADARAAGLSDPPGDPDDPASPARLHAGGTGATAYSDAVATYLGLGVSRTVNRGATLTFWDNTGQKIQQVFARQALPMVWDFVETNFFSRSTGNFLDQVEFPAKSIAMWPAETPAGSATSTSAQGL